MPSGTAARGATLRGVAVSARINAAIGQCGLYYGRPVRGLAAASALKSFRAGALLFRPGEPATSSLVIVTGRIATFTVRPNGQEQHGAVHRAPDAVIEAGLFATTRVHREGARAVTDAEVVLVPRDALLAAAADDRVLAERLLTAFADACTPAPDTAEPVLGRLRELAANLGVDESDGAVRIAARVTQADLATLAGVDRTQVRAALRRLTEAGVLAQRGGCWTLLPG